jgi:hypothetical protein
MQQDKNTKSLSEIASYCQNSSSMVDIFNKLLGTFDLRYINKLFSGAKKRGIDGSKIFQTLFVFRLLDFSNVAQLMQSGFSKELSHKKDVFYDFLNNTKIHWRSIMFLFFKQVYHLIDVKSDQNSDEVKCLIIDDTQLNKTGKTMEFIGKVFDHCTHTYQLGMKMLTLGYTDGKTFLPIDFSIHNEAGKHGKRGLKTKELKAQFSKNRPPKSAGYEREAEVSMDKISVALKMIKHSIKKWLKVDYVLADSWFICEKFIKGIKDINPKLHIIGLMKMNRIVVINGNSYKANKIPELKWRDIKQSRKLKCSYISLKITYKDMEMRGYWIKMNGQNTWNLLVSTNEKLTFVKAMTIYKHRWSIEVFFKDCKQNLGLNECQSKDFDAHIATISIVFMNYIVLALKKRFEDYETLGKLFRDFKGMILKQTVIQRIWNVLTQLFDSVFALMGVDWIMFISTLIDKQDEILQNLNNALESLYSSSKQENT